MSGADNSEPTPLLSRQQRRAQERAALKAARAPEHLLSVVQALTQERAKVAQLEQLMRDQHASFLGLVKDTATLIHAAWPLLDRKRAEMAATVWRALMKPGTALPGPLPGEGPQIVAPPTPGLVLVGGGK